MYAQTTCPREYYCVPLSCVPLVATLRVRAAQSIFSHTLYFIVYDHNIPLSRRSYTIIIIADSVCLFVQNKGKFRPGKRLGLPNFCVRHNRDLTFAACLASEGFVSTLAVDPFTIVNCCQPSINGFLNAEHPTLCCYPYAIAALAAKILEPIHRVTQPCRAYDQSRPRMHH